MSQTPPNYYFLGRAWASRFEKYALVFFLLFLATAIAFVYLGRMDMADSTSRLNRVMGSKTSDASMPDWAKVALRVTHPLTILFNGAFSLFASLAIALHVTTSQYGFLPVSENSTWFRVIPNVLFLWVFFLSIIFIALFIATNEATLSFGATQLYTSAGTVQDEVFNLYGYMKGLVGK